MNADKKRIAELEIKVVQLEAIIVQLFEKIETLMHSKNSRNSSVPPSKDENRSLKNKSLRLSSGKKIGGQPGHEGTTLKMVKNPDKIILHKAVFCSNCGNDLKSIPSEFISRRQIVDIPPIKPEYTEHQIFKTTCSCGFCNVSNFPIEMGNTISYGANIQATIAYLHTRQYLPFSRMSEFFSDFCNLTISQGTICNLLDKFAQKAQPAYDLIAKKITTQEVVGSDETGIKINGVKAWFWAWQNNLMTYIAFSENRGFASIESNFEKGFQKAVLVHDCWSSHFKTVCRTHQLCTAHLLRELIFFEERYQSKWATDFKNLIYKALEVKKNLSTKEYEKPTIKRTEILLALNILLQTPVPKDQKDLNAFHKRITKYKDYVFTFLYYQYVPPDNNGSERAIRNVKVKQKIAGHFKTERGAKIYAIIRSVTDTCIKNEQNILLAFKSIANLKAE
ncbi:IS66 family transposase [Flavobacterium sp.]|uniref:IS66 family transposase n=1 Tax=Flavobacterium sp. TaxID=239 RepID=UPI004047FADC